MLIFNSFRTKSNARAFAAEVGALGLQAKVCFLLGKAVVLVEQKGISESYLKSLARKSGGDFAGT